MQKGFIEMGLFSKKPRIRVCEMCGKADVEGCGSVRKHVVQISADQPEWLPARLRSQAQGEYAWFCLHCNSYPAMKWPDDSGAWAGMMMHLGSKHNIGDLKHMGQPFTMIRAN